MPPAARLTDMTPTADLIVSPGTPTVLIVSLPASGIGDVVTGPVIAGAVAKASATVLIGGRPATRLGDSVVGVNVITGAPMTSSILMPCAPTVMIGG